MGSGVDRVPLRWTAWPRPRLRRGVGAAGPAEPVNAAGPAGPVGPATQTVTFGGYTVSVPASWPVYDLTKNPRQCVRYDIHAVYLGSPRPDQDQDCPPDLVGRVDTISIGSAPEVPKAPEIPKTPEVPEVLPAPQAGPVERGPAGDRKTPARTGQQAGVIVQDRTCTNWS